MALHQNSELDCSAVILGPNPALTFWLTAIPTCGWMCPVVCPKIGYPQIWWSIIIVPTETTIRKAYLHFQTDTICIYMYMYYTHTIYIFYNTHVGENFRSARKSDCFCHMVTDRIIETKDRKIRQHLPLQFFPINEFSPQGLTTKNVVFINNFWPFPCFFL